MKQCSIFHFEEFQYLDLIWLLLNLIVFEYSTEQFSTVLVPCVNSALKDFSLLLDLIIAYVKQEHRSDSIQGTDYITNDDIVLLKFKGF